MSGLNNSNEKDIYSLQSKIESEIYICLFSISNDPETDMKQTFLKILSNIKKKINEIMSSFDPKIEDLKKLYNILYDMKRKYELSQYDQDNVERNQKTIPYLIEFQQNKINTLISSLERKIRIYPFFTINSDISNYIIEIKKVKFDVNKYEEWYNKLTKYTLQYDKSIKIYEEQKKQMVEKIMALVKEDSTIFKGILNDIKSNENLPIDEYKDIIVRITNKQNRNMKGKSNKVSSQNEIVRSPVKVSSSFNKTTSTVSSMKSTLPFDSTNPVYLNDQLKRRIMKEEIENLCKKLNDYINKYHHYYQSKSIQKYITKANLLIVPKNYEMKYSIEQLNKYKYEYEEYIHNYINDRDIILNEIEILFNEYNSIITHINTALRYEHRNFMLFIENLIKSKPTNYNINKYKYYLKELSDIVKIVRKQKNQDVVKQNDILSLIKTYRIEISSHPTSKYKTTFENELINTELEIQSKSMMDRYQISTVITNIQQLRMKYYRNQIIDLRQKLSSCLTNYPHCDPNKTITKYLETHNFELPIKIDETLSIFSELQRYYTNASNYIEEYKQEKSKKVKELKYLFNKLKSKHIQVSANDISQITFLLDNSHTVYPISEYNTYIKTLNDLMIESDRKFQIKMQKAEAEKKLKKYPPNWYYDDPEAVYTSDEVVSNLNNEKEDNSIQQDKDDEKKKENDVEDTLVDELNKQLEYISSIQLNDPQIFKKLEIPKLLYWENSRSIMSFISYKLRTPDILSEIQIDIKNVLDQIEHYQAMKMSLSTTTPLSSPHPFDIPENLSPPTKLLLSVNNSLHELSSKFQKDKTLFYKLRIPSVLRVGTCDFIWDNIPEAMKNIEKIQQIKAGIEYVNKQLKLIEEKRKKEKENEKKIEEKENDEEETVEESNEKEELDVNKDGNSFLSSSSFSIYVPRVPMPSIALDELENDLTDLATLKITNPALFSMLKLSKLLYLPGTSYIRTSLKGLSIREISQLDSCVKSIKSQIRGYQSKLNNKNLKNLSPTNRRDKSFNYSYYSTGNNHNALI